MSTQGFSYLSQEQIKYYDQNGFLCIPDFWDVSVVTSLRCTVQKLLKREELGQSQSIFTTNDQTRKSDEYFLESGREVRYFWEENAMVNGTLTVDAEVAVNKIG
jgi:phytanoyl-CoA hydroxylase